MTDVHEQDTREKQPADDDLVDMVAIFPDGARLPLRAAVIPDVVRLDDYDRAATLLLSISQGNFAAVNEGMRWSNPNLFGMPGVVGQKKLRNAAESLAQKLDRYFSDGPRVTTEQQAMAFVKGLAPHFEEASKALLEAAESLKAAGKVMPANRAYVAHKRAAAKAQELNP